MGEDEAAPFLAQLPEEERFETWHLVERDGTLVSGGAGGIAVLGHLRLTRPLARLFRSLRMTGPLDGLYARVSRSRARLGRFVPNKPGPRRFP